MTEVKLSYATILYEDPVVSVLFSGEVHLEAKEIREMVAVAEEVAGKRPYLLFCDTRVKFHVTPDGLRAAADIKEAPLVIASAILVNNLGLNMMASFFVRFNRPHYPLRIFHDEKKAKEWLMKVRMGE